MVASTQRMQVSSDADIADIAEIQQIIKNG
jgi:hypothetical protein